MSEVVSNGSNTILDAIRQESQKSRPAPGPVPFGATPHHSIRAWRGASPAIIIVAEPAIVIVAAQSSDPGWIELFLAQGFGAGRFLRQFEMSNQ